MKNDSFACAARALRSAELYSAEAGALQKLAPSVKIAAVFAYIVCVVSFPRHDLSGLVAFAFFPVISAGVAKIPLLEILKKSALALPFVAFAGGANLFFERGQIHIVGDFSVGAGALSFAVLVVKTLLCVSAAVILARTTPVNAIADGMRRFKIPCVLVLQFVMTWRYLEALFGEARNIHSAYVLRGGGTGGVSIRHWPMLAGSLLLRALDRAERVYSAMLCRGFNARHAHGPMRAETAAEILFLAAFAALCVGLRLFNVSQFFGGLLT